MCSEPFRAVKPRIGTTPARDGAAMMALRCACGEETVLLADLDIGFTADDAARIAAAIAPADVAWLAGLPSIAAGTIAIPDAPGLSMTLDRERLAPFLVEHWCVAAWAQSRRGSIARSIPSDPPLSAWRRPWPFRAIRAWEDNGASAGTNAREGGWWP
jgi:hypothetical protein